MTLRAFGLVPNWKCAFGPQDPRSLRISFPTDVRFKRTEPSKLAHWLLNGGGFSTYLENGRAFCECRTLGVSGGASKWDYALGLLDPWSVRIRFPTEVCFESTGPAERSETPER